MDANDGDARAFNFMNQNYRCSANAKLAQPAVAKWSTDSGSSDQQLFEASDLRCRAEDELGALNYERVENFCKAEFGAVRPDQQIHAARRSAALARSIASA